MLLRRLLPIALGFALAACGSAERAALEASPSGNAGSLAPSGSSDGTASPSASATSDPIRGKGGSSTRSGSSTSETPGPANDNDFKLVVTLDKTCVEHGDSITATVETIPDVSLAMATRYPDNQQVPDYQYVPEEGNVDGHYTWTWVIRPTLPPGESSLIVVAAGSGKGGARYIAPFRIAPSCP